MAGDHIIYSGAGVDWKSCCRLSRGKSSKSLPSFASVPQASTLPPPPRLRPLRPKRKTKKSPPGAIFSPRSPGS
ncbi:hypothetical protein HPP92_007343 [Vanilla planifolia]|uniref:Uncharacterized protein n=1 Tax=Vanilla planifolia TaxID=51239 RepID=A0A835RAE5_VANPL|nr:hypothetical protein HPP92_007547 [Vanilla planifolia]KAG0490480.1 hypothetical protein HPP92_007343 [Vanilla planifolia]